MTVRIVLAPDSVFQEFLKGDEVQKLLKDHADRIASAAGEGVVVAMEVGPHRARASVITATEMARHNESEDKSLTKALDAGR